MHTYIFTNNFHTVKYTHKNTYKNKHTHTNTHTHTQIHGAENPSYQ